MQQIAYLAGVAHTETQGCYLVPALSLAGCLLIVTEAVAFVRMLAAGVAWHYHHHYSFAPVRQQGVGKVHC